MPVKLDVCYAFVRFVIDSVEISTAAAISSVAYWCKDCLFTTQDTALFDALS